MTNTYLSFALIIFILLISQGSAFSEDNAQSGVTDPAYLIIDHESFNKSVKSAKGEEWTTDPVTISLKFTAPFVGLTQNIQRNNDSAEFPQTATVIITNEGLSDDSVMGERYKLVFKRTADETWLIQSAGKVVKCWQGRGHQEYSKEPCM